MKVIIARKTSKTNRIFRLIDYSAFAALTVLLVIIVISSGRANIQTDSIDYYAIVQRLTQNSGNPIARNLHFVEQRSPGYPILSLIPYYLISSLVEPFVQTEKIVTPSTSGPPGQAPTERMLLPNQPILFRDVFFKDLYIETQDSWFEWKIIASMLFTSYAFLFIGLTFAVKSLALEDGPFLGASLAPLVVITSPAFMHNIINTPAYATLTAFGLSGLFGYFFVKGSLEKRSAPQFLSGLFVGLLVLTRLETIVIATTVLVSLVVIREFGFLKNYVLGALAPAVILLLYNLTQFGNPFHLGILAGDINLISLDWSYIYANLFSPQSGILFWSTLASFGIIGLFLDDRHHARILGIGSLALIALILVRVPVTYYCVGEGTRFIGRLPIICPNNMAEMVTLIRFDANRYITVLFPFSILGLRRLAMKSWHMALIFALAIAVLAGCGRQATPTLAPAGVGGETYTSAVLDTSYPDALPVSGQLALGILRLEGTEHAVTPEQAKALLPLWKALRGGVTAQAEVNAVLKQIEGTMTQEQLEAIAAMRLTQDDLRAWVEEQGLQPPPPSPPPGTPPPGPPPREGGPGPEGGGRGPSPEELATRQAQFESMSEEERAALRATAEAGGMPAGPGPRPGPGRPGPGPAAILLDPLIELLTQRATE